jgi:pSer/pThr/pTyr-binding forkhead associated (FHA) protein
MPKVVIFRGRKKEGSVQLKQREYVLGRAEESGIRVDNPLVSRRHAMIEFAEGAWRARDLDAPNGLYVNGKRVQVHKLHAGDRMEFGQHVVIFQGSGDEDWDVSTAPAGRFTQRLPDEPTTILPPREIESIHRRVRARMDPHVVLEHAGRRQEFLLNKESHKIGWSEACDIRLPGSALLGKEVAELIRRGETWSVLALSALSPLRVGGEKVSQRDLKDGDLLQVKDVELVFHDGISGKRTPLSAPGAGSGPSRRS